MSKKIIKIRKNDSGDVTDVMLSNGDIFSLNHVMKMAKEGVIEGVCVGDGRNGAQFLKMCSDSSTSDNLGDLPVF